ncbi:MAG: hypothetical protein MJ240_04910 [Kiritimatiellae bacterium]|nr:hypothetical protein [Kiritimatiellia bacterium]
MRFRKLNNAVWVWGVCCASAVWAETATWITPTNSVSRQFTDSVNWQEGIAPNQTAGLDYDFSAEPTVITSGTSVYHGQALEIDKPAYPNADQNWGRVWGGYGRRLQFERASYNPTPKMFIADPNDFFGSWSFFSQWELTLGATASFTPVLQRVYAPGAVNYRVAEAGTTAVISNFYGRGLLRKSGDGTLVVAEASGPALAVRHYAGPLRVQGAARLTDDELNTVLGTAAFHVDATRADTFVTSGERIAEWHDVRGAAYPYAKVCGQNGKILPLPWLAPAAHNGLAMVDFGTLTNDHAKAAETGLSAGMAWSKDFGNNWTGPYVLEAFIVQGFNDSSAVKLAPIFGNLWDKTFRRQSSGTLVRTDTGATSSDNTRSNLNSRDGDFAINGTGVTPDTVLTTPDVRLFSFRAREDGYTRFSAFAVDYGYYAGGVKIGEAIFFTNFLTRVERRNVMRYLQKKWNLAWDSGEAEADVGVWHEEAADTAFDVPAGDRVGIRELSWGANALEKTGAGELAVGAVYPATTGSALPVTVSGGKLSFLSHVTPAANAAPAAAPYRHYDADDAASVVADEQGVTTWKDQSGEADRDATRLAQSRAGGFVLGYPQRVTANGPNGRAYIDLGVATGASSAESKGSSAFLFDRTQMSSDSSKLTEAFLVFRRKSGAAPGWFLGSYLGVNVDFHPSDVLLRDVYSNPYVQGGEVAKNGLPIDPLTDKSLQEWCVLRFTPLNKAHAATLGADRGAGSASYQVGGLEFGEVILYDRTLTRQERIDTEAYLMRKWLGKEHPLSASKHLASLNFSGSAEAALDVAAGTVQVDELQVTGNTFTKTGSGALVANRLDGSVTALTVADGTLDISTDEDKIAFHFDAMDSDAFTTFVSGEPGALQTNVVSWADTRRNGIAANAYLGYASVTNPTLVSVETRPGVYRPVVDFGAYAGNLSQAVNSAGLVFSKRFTNIAEAFTVHADKNVNCFIFSDSSVVNYHRGGNGAMLNYKYSLTEFQEPEAVICLDGAPVAYDAPLTVNAFHVLSFAPAGAVTTSIAQMALDRRNSSYRCGGMRCGEQIGFTEKLSPERRAFWTRRLMRKWFDEGEAPAWTNANFQTLVLGAQATLKLPPDTVLASVDVTAGGTLQGGLVLTDGAALNLTLGAPLTVTGCFGASGDVSLAVTLPEGVKATDVEFGDYPLVAAAACDVDLTRWTFTTPLVGGKIARLVRTDEGLALRVVPKGLTLSFR